VCVSASERKRDDFPYSQQKRQKINIMWRKKKKKVTMMTANDCDYTTTMRAILALLF
jgi:hypothetical protein